jgi:hypothetical protein
MESKKQEIVQLELKYCERCGGLWLRVRGEQGPYCSSCAPAMSGIAIMRKSKRPPRLPIHDIHSQHTSSLFLKGGQA